MIRVSARARWHRLHHCPQNFLHPQRLYGPLKKALLSFPSHFMKIHSLFFLRLSITSFLLLLLFSYICLLHFYHNVIFIYIS